MDCICSVVQSTSSLFEVHPSLLFVIQSVPVLITCALLSVGLLWWLLLLLASPLRLIWGLDLAGCLSWSFESLGICNSTWLVFEWETGKSFSAAHVAGVVCYWLTLPILNSRLDSLCVHLFIHSETVAKMRSCKYRQPRYWQLEQCFANLILQMNTLGFWMLLLTNISPLSLSKAMDRSLNLCFCIHLYYYCDYLDLIIE